MRGEEDVAERKNDHRCIVSLHRKMHFSNTRGQEGLAVGEANNLAARAEGGEESARADTVVGSTRVDQKSIACSRSGVDDRDVGL